MKTYLIVAALAVAFPAAAQAAAAPTPAPKAEMKCCCEKMDRKMACCEEHMKKDKDGESGSDVHKGHGGH
jgi:opacity protein-like surface antigen